MNKKVKWILISLGIIIVILVVGKMLAGGDSSTIKVSTEKAAKRTIIETVNASGKIYPEIEVKISPDISGEITELNVEEGDSVWKGKVLARIYADIYSLQRDEAASRVSQSREHTTIGASRKRWQSRVSIRDAKPSGIDSLLRTLLRVRRKASSGPQTHSNDDGGLVHG